MTLRMRVLPRFPAKITGTNGLTVDRPAGTPDLIVKPDFGSLVQIPNVGDGDNVFFMAWDRLLGLYRIMSFNDLFEGVASLGFMDSAVYDPTNKHQDIFAYADLNLPRTGGTMSGPIAMGSNKITGLANGTVSGDAVHFGQVDGKVVYASKSGNYTAVAADNNAVHRFTAAATASLTAAATLGANWHYTVTADGGAVTIDPNGSETINGLATLVVPNGSSCTIICDGTNFYTVIKPQSWEPVQGGLFTLSAASQLVLTDLGAYRKLRFSGTLVHSAASSPLRATVSTNNGSSYDTANNYAVFSKQQTSGGSNTAAQAAQGGIAMAAGSGIDAGTRQKFSGEIEDFNQNSPLEAVFNSKVINSAIYTDQYGGTSYPTATARNALRIFPVAGTVTGHILVEGVRG